MIDILEKKKLVFKECECPPVVVPQYRELSVSNILKQVLPHTELAKYLPDKCGKRYMVN